MQQKALLKRRLSIHVPKIKKIIFGFLIGLILLLGIFVYRGLSDLHLSPSWIWHIFWSESQYLKQSEGRSNFLLLGIGGQNHDGGALTDTIQVVSVDFQNKRTVMIAIPRDLWVPTLKDRINTAYEVGEGKQSGSGLVMAKAAVEEVIGLPIHYAVLIDFSGFQKIVDALGGIDVVVGESFTDSEYPISGRENDLCDGDPTFACRYETVSFTKGIEHMDGARALIFARSRHAEGDVGTDFSRGRRQQAVIMAIRDRMMRTETILNLPLLQRLYVLATSTVETDLEVGESLLAARLISGSVKNMTSVGITEDQGEDTPGLLIHPPEWEYGGKWVLVPKNEDFTHVHDYVSCRITNSSDCERFFE